MIGNAHVANVYDDLVKMGLKVETKGNSILLKNTKGETVAIKTTDKLTIVKWRSRFNYTNSGGKETGIIETPEGYWILKQGDDVRVDLGFKDGRKLTAEETNDYLVNSGRVQKEGQPYKAGTIVEERYLNPGEKFYVVELPNGGTPNPGGFATKYPITTIEELRRDLAVLREWKDEVDNIVIREYEVIAPIRTRSGIIGPQLEKTGINADQIYPGGAHQYEFIDYLGGNNWEKFIKAFGDKRGLKLE